MRIVAVAKSNDSLFDSTWSKLSLEQRELLDVQRIKAPLC
jgi:hypothetical protein